MSRISRDDYAALFGPTAGDQIRLGDTDLWIEIEQDLTVRRRGGGVRRRQVHPRVDGPVARHRRAEGALDTVITNAIILDHWGIVRADVGIRDGRIVGIGRSGNPDIADGVDPALLIGPGTDVISGEGKILTAGGFDSHVHFLSPVADHRGAGHRADHPRRRRHRTLGGHQGHDRHPGRLAPQEVPPLAGRVPGQPAAARQGQHRVRWWPSRSRRWPVPAATRCTRTGVPPPPPSTPR